MSNFSLESDDVGMLKFAKVFYLCLFDVPHFLHGYILSVKLAQEYSALCTTAHPLQVRYLLKWNLPGF